MSSDDLLPSLIAWCRLAKLQVTRTEDLNVDFHLVVFEPNLPQIEIVHPQPESSFVILSARVAVSDEAQRKLLSYDMARRNELVRDIRLRLLSSGIEFSIFGAKDEPPRVYELYSRLFVKSSTIQSFWEAYVKLKSVIVMILTLYRDFTESV